MNPIHFDHLSTFESLDFTSYKHIYVDVCDGDICAGILLARIIYWFGKSKETKKLRTGAAINGRPCLIKTRKDWWDECRISERVYDRCLKILIEKGYVISEIHKSPFHDRNTVVHLFIEKECLMNAINLKLCEEDDESRNYETVNPDSPNGDSGITPPLFQNPQTVSPSYITKTISKGYQQQQESGGGDSSIFPILVNLEIPHEDKVEISARYLEKVVIDAVGWATDPRNPPEKCLAASLKYACKTNRSKVNLEPLKKESTEISEDEQFRNKELAKKFQRDNWNEIKIKQGVDVNVEYVKIMTDTIYYRDAKFKELFEHFCRKHQLLMEL